MKQVILIITFTLITITNSNCKNKPQPNNHLPNISNTKIAEIPLHKGFERIISTKNSFANWLQQFPLNKSNVVYLFDGSTKGNQQLHAAVLDVSVGTKNLQQCADAIVRLKAEYHLSKKEYSKIEFKTSETTYNFNEYGTKKQCFNHDCLLAFLELTFTYYGTYNLEDQLKKVTDYNSGSIGDVFIKAGAPGHAMMVADVAINKISGEKYFCYYKVICLHKVFIL